VRVVIVLLVAFYLLEVTEEILQVSERQLNLCNHSIHRGVRANFKEPSKYVVVVLIMSHASHGYWVQKVFLVTSVPDSHLTLLRLESIDERIALNHIPPCEKEAILLIEVIYMFSKNLCLLYFLNFERSHLRSNDQPEQVLESELFQIFIATRMLGEGLEQHLRPHLYDLGT
jgi:hypothetical protein